MGMEVEVQYVGIVRAGEVNSRLLVQAGDGFFYTWKGSNEKVKEIQDAGRFSCDACDLELATEQQVSIGRNHRGTLDAVSVSVKFHGLIQRGKIHFRVLVSDPGSGFYYTVVIPVGDLPEPGSLISVDRRQLFEARDDQIAAGNGLGKLRRASRKAVGSHES
jgi:hypothetical protein